jgi:hypothetical protein
MLSKDSSFVLSMIEERNSGHVLGNKKMSLSRSVEFEIMQPAWCAIFFLWHWGKILILYTRVIYAAELFVQMRNSEVRCQLECWKNDSGMIWDDGFWTQISAGMLRKKCSGIISDDEFWSQISAGMLKKNYSGMIFRSKIQDDHVTEPIQCEANVPWIWPAFQVVQ